MPDKGSSVLSPSFRIHRTAGRRLEWVLLLSLWLVGFGRADVHVSPHGSDTNPGTAILPFATPERARDALRELRQKGHLRAGAVTVWMHGGDYLRSSALSFTAEDSGTSNNPVRWKAWRGEHVRWLGGQKLNAFEPVTDPAILVRLPPNARGQVFQAHLGPSEVSRIGRLTSRGFSRPTSPSHTELFFGGRPMTLARWPNAGEFESIAGLPTGSSGGDGHGGELGDSTRGFLIAGDRPARWKQSDDIWVHGYWAWDWANSYERVTTLDLPNHRIQTAPPHAVYGFRKGQHFYHLNVLEELDQPGEWWMDTTAGRIYFWPPGGPESLRQTECLVSLTEEPLVRFNQASHIHFSEAILEATRGSAVEIQGGSGVRIEGCVIRNIGTWGVIITGGSGNGVRGCDLWDCGDGGVQITGGNRDTLEPGGHYVEDCDFRRQGRWSKCYVPAVLLQGVGLRVSHCEIQQHPHCAILFWGNDHLIEFNNIHHVALETGDVGAIYTGRDYTYRGNRIRSNFIHETGGVGMGSMGVYMDDCVSGTEVAGNAFWKVHWAMFIGGGRDHQVVGNLFVDCDPAIRIDGRGLDPSPVWRDMVDQTMRQSLAAVPRERYRAAYPALKSLDAYYGAPDGPAKVGPQFRGVPPAGNLIASNVVVGKWLESGWHATDSSVELRGNWVGASLPFRNGAQGDFRPGPGSPLARLGYPPIAFDQIGPRPTPERLHLVRLVRPDSP